MSRRILGAATAAVLLCSGIAPMLGTAHANACASWVDPEGDASTNQMNLPATTDANMDIRNVAVTTEGNEVVATLKVTDLYEVGYSDMGDEFTVQMTIGGVFVRFVARRSETAETAAVIGGLANSAPTGVATAEFDPYANTVAIRTTIAELDKAAAKPTTGLDGTSLQATTSSHVNGNQVMAYDSSAPSDNTLVYKVAAPCTPAIPARAPLPQPAADCKTFEDGPDDASPTVAASATSGNEPTLDISTVALNSTADALYAYIKVKQLGDKPTNYQGDRYQLSFKIGTKAYEISAGRMYLGKSVGSHQTRGTLAGATNAGLKVYGTFDKPKNTVVVKLDRVSLTTVHGSAVTDGTTLTDVTAATFAVLGSREFAADTAQATAATDRVYTLGVSPCFAPPPAVLTNVGVRTVQFTDTAAIAAKLAEKSGAALADRTVSFAVGGKTFTATTDEAGVARVTVNPALVAGSYSLVASFVGDATADKTSLTTPFTVTQEKTKVVLTVVKSGTKRTVTAKLTDDDGKPVAGQVVAWYVNGKKVSAPRTNSAGAVTLTTAKPTQTVKALFTAVAGKYLGATAQQKV